MPSIISFEGVRDLLSTMGAAIENALKGLPDSSRKPLSQNSHYYEINEDEFRVKECMIKIKLNNNRK